MKTPLLPAGKQKQSLSAKKKKINKVTIKNILVQPYTNYWPVLNEEDCCTLNKQLEEHLSIIKPPKVKIPWKEIQNIPREDRQAFRLKYAEGGTQDATSEKLVVFGINEVTKLLESDEAASILLTSDVNPQLMLKHVVDEAVLKNVPLLVVPQLKTLLKKKTGIGSLAFAIKNCTSESNYFNIIKLVQELAVKYPVSFDHVNSLYRFNPVPSIEPKLIQNNLTKDKVKCDNNSNSESEEEENLHLSRTSRSSRIFEPQDKGEKRLLDFIGFEEDTPVIKKPTISKPKSKISYKSLLIKRVVNNPNRSKKGKL